MDYPSYEMKIKRIGADGKEHFFMMSGYGLLRELFDDMEKHAEKRGWFVDEGCPFNPSAAVLEQDGGGEGGGR